MVLIKASRFTCSFAFLFYPFLSTFSIRFCLFHIFVLASHWQLYIPLTNICRMCVHTHAKTCMHANTLPLLCLSHSLTYTSKAYLTLNEAPSTPRSKYFHLFYKCISPQSFSISGYSPATSPLLPYNSPRVGGGGMGSNPAPQPASPANGRQHPARSSGGKLAHKIPLISAGEE